MPPAVQHAHAQGGQSHSHHTHKHHHPHSHPHTQQAEQQANLGAVPTPHLHLTLFGIDFDLPARDSQNTPNDGLSVPGAQAETLVRLLAPEVVLPSASLVEGLFVSLPSLASIPTLDTGVAPSRCGWDIHASLPLCDSARGKRSGVQLI